MDENKNIDWYSQKTVYDWYAPNFAAEPTVVEAPAAPAKKPRRKRTGMKVTMIVICVLVLVAATALAFSDGMGIFGGSEPSLSQPSERPSTGTDLPDDFHIGIPDIDNIPNFDELFPNIDPDIFERFDNDDEGENEGTVPVDPEDMPDDFRDFFDSYYTMEESIAPSNIPRAATVEGKELKISSAVGEELLSLQQLYSLCSPSVVGVIAEYGDSLGYGWGSGIVLDASGYIITNAHVISEAESCTVVLWNGKECPALLVGEDSHTDLAVLKIEAKGLIPATFGDSDELSVGDEVVAIGNPLGIEFSGTLTNGIVSAINRNVDYSGTSMSLIQTNAAINEGNSGGPLINMYGQIIGITSMKMTNQYGVTIEGIGFAIPSTTVKKVVDQILVNGKVLGRPGIGITCGSVPQEAMEEYGLPEGLYVTEVSEESDAKTKGILPGDVITHVNGQQVLITDDLIAIRDEHEIGDILLFTVYRDGKTFDVEIEIYDLGNIY